MHHKGFGVLILMLGLALRSTGQEAHSFPVFHPDTIGKVRNEFSLQNRSREALDYLRSWRAYEGAPVTHEDSAAYISLHDALGRTFLDLRQIDSIEGEIKPFLDISPVAFPKQYLQIQNTWGVRLVYGGRFADAKKHYERLRKLLDSGELPAPPLDYCNTVHNLGVANLQLGDTDAALEVFHHIDDYMTKHQVVNDRLSARLHFNIAGVYSQLGISDKQILHSNKSHEYNVKIYGHDHPESAMTLNSVANAIMQSGDLEKAIQTYQEGLAIFDRLNEPDHPLRSLLQLNLAETLDKMYRTEEALPFIEASVAIRRKTYGLRHSEVARGYKSKGTILGHLGRYEEAVANLDTALLALGYDAASENPYAGVEAMFNLFYTLDHRADVFFDVAKREPTLDHLTTARNAYEHGIHVLNDLRVHFKGKLAKGTLNKKSYNFYEPAIDVCLRRFEQTGEAVDLERAMQWSSESKGNDFYELIRGESAMLSASVPDSIRKRDDEYQQALAELESAWYDARSGQENEITSARQSLDQTQTAYVSWLKTVEQRYPRYYELLHANPEFEIKARQKELASSSSQLIEYFIGDTNAVAFIMTPNSLKYIRLAHPDVITNTVKAWQSDLENTSTPSELSTLIWQPVTEYLENSDHLIIIPDGILASIPFEVLENNDGDLVLGQFAVSYAYSSRGSLHSRSVKGQRWLGIAPEYNIDNGPLAMASPGIDSAVIRLRDAEWMSLPGAQKEVKSIALLTSGEEWLGKRATESAFRAMAGKFGILHLSMHAWTDDDEPLLSTLIFSDDETDTVHDGRLHAHEIFQMHLPAKLAVLSACNTGVGIFKRGEGISSLARAFMYAGTEATVMSLWKVPDESTAVIMQAFYKHLRAGMRKDEALRNAKLDYLASVTEPEQKRPYYWAGFVLMGDPSPVYTSTFPLGLVSIGAGILLIVGLFVWMRSQKA